MCYLSIFCAIAPLAAILGFIIADSPRIGRSANPLTVAIVSGALWPLLLVGMAQLAVIMGMGRALRAHSPTAQPALLERVR